MAVEWTWDEEGYGPPEMFNVDVGTVERDEFKLGDYVVATRDHESIFEGEEGTIIGFTKPTPVGTSGMGGSGEGVCVHWDGMDPSVVDASMIEISD
jgi:hypothetical protein